MSEPTNQFAAGEEIQASKVLQNDTEALNQYRDFTLGETIAANIPVYLKASDNKIYKTTSANDTETIHSFVGFLKEAGNANDVKKVQTGGIVSSLSGMTAGAKIYLQDTAGNYGTVSGTYEKLIGVALTTTTLFLRTAPQGMLTLKDQTLTGVKTFGSIPILPASDPTTDNQVARKAFIDRIFRYLQRKIGIDNFTAITTLRVFCNFFTSYNFTYDPANVFYSVESDKEFTNADIVINRYKIDAITGLPYKTHSITTSLTKKTDTKTYGCVIGSYIYISHVVQAETVNIYRYSATDLTGEQLMSYSGGTPTFGASGNPIFTDGTYIYIWDNNVAKFVKYSISGTTLTDEGDQYAFYGSSLWGGYYCDGTYVYCDGNTNGIKKYQLSNGSLLSTTLIKHLEYASCYGDDPTYAAHPWAGFVPIDSYAIALMRYGNSITNKDADRFYTFAYLNPITKP